MSAIPVTNTISEIMERMSSFRGFGQNITENIKHHLTAIQNKCLGSAKLDLSDPKTKKWLGQVTELFYLVDDLCAKAALLSKQRKMMPLFPTCNLKPLLQLRKIEKQLAREVAPMKNVKMLPIRDVEEEKEAETVVRGYVKEKIMKSILDRKKGVVRAVVIFGITGLEKGKVTEYACEDENVKSGFDVVVPIDGLHLEQHFADSVVDRVKHELEAKKKKDSGEGKGFFVVLDDFHNENHGEWLQLMTKLKEAAQAHTSTGGGVLLVTTRNEAVLKSVNHTFFSVRCYQFDSLDLSESQPLFEKIVGTRATTIGSKTKGDLLEHMCGGILGAVKSMARLVRSQNPTTESDINALKDEFVQEMLLKYYSEFDLPSWRLRQCFAYSLFRFYPSTDFVKEFVKEEELIRLWMAEGFLGHSSSQHEPEDLGHECIQEFLRRSIFSSQEDGCISINKSKALTTILAGNDRVYMEDNGTTNDNIRRLLKGSNMDVSTGNFRSLFKNNKSVRTFLLEEKQQRVPDQVMLSWLACDAILSAFTRLRVLTLKDLGMKVLPASIGDLKSLRYVDLSRNNFNKLPICIGELQHLQTLLLFHCLKLRELPDEVHHFPSLRHLDVDKCMNLMHMPSALKKLTWLRSLPHFVTSKRNGLEELLHLNQLRGDLEISHLERFKCKGSSSNNGKDHDHPIYLKEKQHLEGLTLRWNHDDEKKKHSLEDYQLQNLEPHPNLKRLFIIGYPGNQFPTCLLSLKNLVEISLYNCPKWKHLPIVDQPLIKKLTLVSLADLEFITDKDNSLEELPLERVRILDCPNLTSWGNPETCNTTAFSGALSELVVEYCPKLDSMPLFPKIKNKLVLDHSSMKPLLNTLGYKSDTSPPLSELKQLTVNGCEDLKSNIKGWKHLSKLETLHISNCTQINLPSEEWKGLKGLTDLVIEDIPDLKSLPEEIKHLASEGSLDSLEIKSCHELTTMLDFGEYLHSFAYILIEDCPNLDSLPDSYKDNFFTPLKIQNCPLLKDSY
ncbi:hypothetical protein AAZX31_09G244000 [Glycine max]|nr:hypothetical protein JHK86_026403 [Glycine max]KAH1044960.1 hypothetical protein GYH30_026273 [Glycine max]KAH1044961.1 hypothetical protein GYH30_026273 [Glycine max]KAH1044962.1 hypothetical protein GYH30_026273 [Glycine max]